MKLPGKFHHWCTPGVSVSHTVNHSVGHSHVRNSQFGSDFIHRMKLPLQQCDRPSKIFKLSNVRINFQCMPGQATCGTPAVV